MERQTFKIQIDNGKIQDAQVLAVVEIEKKDYAIYIVDNKNGTSNILASYVIQDEDGYDILKDIIVEEDKIKITNFIKEMLK